MKKILLSLFILGGISASAQPHSMKIILDTKLYTQNDMNRLNADGLGGPSPLGKVYMHGGLCWYNGNVGPTDFASNPAELFCIQQITPLESEVWQSVVGNWGNNPQDDGVGLMTKIDDGKWRMEIVVEQYFSSPQVSLDANGSGVTSQPMNPSAIPYTMGMVFRDSSGTISGRDPVGGDIFIWKLNTSAPEIITSQLANWANGPVYFEYGFVGVDEPQISYNRQISPNPFSEQVQIKFFLTYAQENFSMEVFDALGRKVKTIHEGQLPAGTQFAFWDGTNDNGVRLENGIYYFTMKAANSVVTDKVILSR
ncbi:MAG: hypothetical protein RLZZ46_1259 [Bacteroidota bacterium]|jgi:hypothetical protein